MLESNPGPLEEQPMFLPSQRSLQAPSPSLYPALALLVKGTLINLIFLLLLQSGLFPHLCEHRDGLELKA